MKPNFVFALLKLIVNYFSAEPNFHQYHKLDLHLALKNYSCDCQDEMMNYSQHQKLQLS